MVQSIYKFLLNFIKLLIGIFLFFVLIFVGLSFWFAYFPVETQELIQKTILPSDLRVQWSEFNLKGRKKSWTRWNIDLRIKQLRVEKTSPRLAIPVDDIQVVFNFSFFDPAVRIGFAHLHIISKQKILIQLDAKSSSVGEPGSLYQKISPYLRYIDFVNRFAVFDNVEFHLKKIVLSGLMPEPLIFEIGLNKRNNFGKTTALLANLRADGPDLQLAVRASLAMQNYPGNVPFLKVTGNTRFGKIRHRGTFYATYTKTHKLLFSYKGKVVFVSQGGEFVLDPSISGELAESGLVVTLQTSVSGLPKPVSEVKQIAGKIELPFKADQNWSEQPGLFKLSGRIPLSFGDKLLPLQFEKVCQCRVPKNIAVTVDGQFWPQNIFSKSAFKRPLADFALSTDPVRNQLLILEGSTSVKISRNGEQFEFEPRLNSRLKIGDFQKFRALLDLWRIAIPAPFDVLQGSIEVIAHEPILSTQSGEQTEVTIKTNLKSEHQQVVFASTVRFLLNPARSVLDVLMKVKIEDFIIELPPIDPMAGIPALMPDPRVEMQPPASSTASEMLNTQGFKLRFRWAAETLKDSSIRLMHRYADPYVPLSINVQRDPDGDVVGYAQTQTFYLQYLRRRILVERLRVLIDESAELSDFPVDGRLRVDQTQYAILAEIAGTLRSPIIKLSSEPELSRSDIISVLLFDRRQDQLVGGDAETAGHFEAAMADRAIGLLGLWAFASTPIRNFSYNAVTKMYAATVQISNTVTASLGTNWEEAAHFELRKRISRRWVLTASWVPGEIDTQMGRLVLQWEKRF